MDNSFDSPDDKKMSDFSTNSNTKSNGQPVILEQERFMPIANISRIMKRVLPEHAKLSKESKECIQECITEFFLFITSEAAEKCNTEKRKTITGEDLLASMETLGFDNYLLPLRAFLKKYKDATRSERPSSDIDEGAEPHSSRLSNDSRLQAAYISPPSQAASAAMNNNSNYHNQQAYIIQEAEPPHHQDPQPPQDVVDDIEPYLPPNFRRATGIFIDSTTQQHYISATSPGGSTGLIPIELRALASEAGGLPQPISVQTLNQQSRQMNGH